MQSSPIRSASPKKLGLIGGISWVSTIDYYRLINEGFNRRLGGLHFAECLIYSINFNNFQRNNTLGHWDATAQLLTDACQSLERAGADAIVLCANTAHAVADKVAQHIGLPIIHVVTATAAAIRQQGFTKVGLLGTQFTMEMDFYKNGLAQQGIEAMVPPSQTDRDYIQQTLKEELGRGIVLPDTKAAYLRIIDQLIAAGAQGIILGCTEIPLLLGQADVSVPVFDTTQIHAAAAVDFALAGMAINS
jgi:aspartate racemase